MSCTPDTQEWAATAPLPALPTLQCDVQFPEASNTPLVHTTVAVTPDETARGLMFRKEPLGENNGMLFALRDQRLQVFHMKNTFIPLDMIFINEDFRVVGIVENATPKTTSPRKVAAQSRYVLEVDGGWSKRHGVQAGQRVIFSPIPPSKAPENSP